MFRLFSMNTKHKLIGIIVTAISFALLASSIAFAVYDRYSSRENILQQQRTLGKIIAMRSAAAMSFNDVYNATANLKTLNGHASVEMACMYKEDTLFAEYHKSPSTPNQAQRKCESSMPWQDNVLFLDHQLRTLYPIDVDSGRIGSLYLVTSLDALERRSLVFLAFALLFFTLVGALAAGFASTLIQIVTRPLLGLGRTAQIITRQGDYSVRSKKLYDDDIGQLVDAFNGMLNTIEEQNTALTSIAFYDSLTGLPNRRKFKECLDEELARCDKDQAQMALMFLDLDNFKRINDTLGHDAGDRLLITIAERLLSCVRKGDVVSRLGGDEFTVLLSGLDGEEPARRVADKILTALRQPIALGGETITVTMSIGITMAAAQGEDPIELMKFADIAMYKAKEGGKNNYCFFRPEML
ncbi:MAG: diguanylate cyclase [Pseudomonadales bacterium]|nr:diguanylate cyclase [Pseudomonadales bacterium]